MNDVSLTRLMIMNKLSTRYIPASLRGGSIAVESERYVVGYRTGCWLWGYSDREYGAIGFSLLKLLDTVPGRDLRAKGVPMLFKAGSDGSLLPLYRWEEPESRIGAVGMWVLAR